MAASTLKLFSRQELGQLRLLPTEELNSNKKELIRERLSLLILKKRQELKTTHKLRMIRRKIAQLNTLIDMHTS
jgi:ribosomal protein L29